MRKLRLEVEALVVESFATDADARGAGTVRGAADAFYAPVTRTDCPECTGQPIETCTCECPPPPTPGCPPPPPSDTCPPPYTKADTCCYATYGPCTCEPIETCTCGAVG